MQRLLISALVGVIGLSLPALACNGEKCDAACEVPHKTEAQTPKLIPGGKLVTLNLEGVKCGKCAAKIEAKLKALTGVHHVSIDVEKKTAAVMYMPGKVGVPAMLDAVKQAGYKAKQG